MRISDWSSDGCYSDLSLAPLAISWLAGVGECGSLVNGAGGRDTKEMMRIRTRTDIADAVFRGKGDRCRRRRCSRTGTVTECRSEERSGGKECVGTCRTGWWTYH